MIRLSELRNKPIRTLDGERLGKVHEVHCDGGRIVALKCGAASWLESMTGKNEGHKIDWSGVKRITADAVIVGPPETARTRTKPKASGARTPQGTRRPSGPRSKR